MRQPNRVARKRHLFAPIALSEVAFNDGRNLGDRPNAGGRGSNEDGSSCSGLQNVGRSRRHRNVELLVRVATGNVKKITTTSDTHVGR